MTESEASKVLNMIETHGPLPTMAKEMSIKALEKQMKLNEMGDCYIIPKNGVFEVNGVDVNLAIQKQIPKKVKIEQWIYTKCDCGFEFSKHHGDGYYSIPLENKTKYCPNCGQKLDWSDEE